MIFWDGGRVFKPVFHWLYSIGTTYTWVDVVLGSIRSCLLEINWIDLRSWSSSYIYWNSSTRLKKPASTYGDPDVRHNSLSSWTIGFLPLCGADNLFGLYLCTTKVSKIPFVKFCQSILLVCLSILTQDTGDVSECHWICGLAKGWYHGSSTIWVIQVFVFFF